MKEKKTEGCIRPYMHGCKGCELNEVPELFDGGCWLNQWREGKKIDDRYLDIINKALKGEQAK